jgi:ElaB/YqjD/DUF883 family membrane-anchored ribosome-binding protein
MIIERLSGEYTMAEGTDNKRQEIKERIAAAQERQAARDGTSITQVISEKAVQARDGVTGFAREHPVAAIAGGLAVGVLISAMFKNSPTRRAGRYAGARAAGLATLGSEIAASLVQQVIEGASTARSAGAEKLEDAGEAISGSAHSARKSLGHAGDAVRDTAREVGKAIARSMHRG